MRNKPLFSATMMLGLASAMATPPPMNERALRRDAKIPSMPLIEYVKQHIVRGDTAEVLQARLKKLAKEAYRKRDTLGYKMVNVAENAAVLELHELSELLHDHE